MTDLTHAERSHLDAFMTARPDWSICALGERIVDEGEGGRSHKYQATHPYVSGMHYVLRKMQSLAPCSVLDIGSPIAQNVALSCQPDVDVTILDVREFEDADALGLKWKQATATALPYPDATWSVVTSLWVMGHVGDGRYGDALDPEGDRKMLAEIARVLKPGGVAIIGAGLVDEQGGYIFNLHRIYTWAWLREAFERAGFEVMEEKNLAVPDEVFITLEPRVDAERRNGHYALALLKKR